MCHFHSTIRGTCSTCNNFLTSPIPEIIQFSLSWPILSTKLMKQLRDSSMWALSIFHCQPQRWHLNRLQKHRQYNQSPWNQPRMFQSRGNCPSSILETRSQLIQVAPNRTAPAAGFTNCCLQSFKIRLRNLSINYSVPRTVEWHLSQLRPFVPPFHVFRFRSTLTANGSTIRGEFRALIGVNIFYLECSPLSDQGCTNLL